MFDARCLLYNGLNYVMFLFLLFFVCCSGYCHLWLLVYIPIFSQIRIFLGLLGMVVIIFRICFLPPACFWKTAGGIVLDSIAVSTVSTDVLLYISVAIKARFFRLGMCNICKNNIAKMFLDFFKI